MATLTNGAAILAIAGAAWAGQSATLVSAHRKFSAIEDGRAPAGSSVRITAAELAAYAREQAEVLAPGAVHGTVFSVTPGHAEATASVNFLKLREGEGQNSGWLMRQLLDGERPVKVRVRFRSARGRARVDVERVEISGVPVEGRALDFLVSRFVIPSFPDARVGRWFALGHNIDHFDTRPGSVTVWLGPKSAGDQALRR